MQFAAKSKRRFQDDAAFLFAKYCVKFSSAALTNFPRFWKKFATHVKAFCCRLETGFNFTPGCKPGAASLRPIRRGNH
jgi:hypothetical protein